MSNQEIIRREQYCQIVNEIYGSETYLVVGIDVAKEKHYAFMGTATGHTLQRKLIFENNIEGFTVMPLTHTAIKNAKIREKQYKLTDERGMYLLVNHSGKYFRLNYRFGGKRKTLALGV